ncbi:hypothetical protein H5410_061686 [Solanum commersonii]|uniref:Trichome birefringence-like C-terminal domain-containing protein n=1 Tax=Solanum commersonii TaxID=4109 RepID=A0A9J5W9X4_SOLCO|nr:hypothetical protein H5410_061686 [Solanum commersonii]
MLDANKRTLLLHQLNRNQTPLFRITIGDKLYKEMDHMKAYKIALTTWGNWVDSNIDSVVTKVFFQGIYTIFFNLVLFPLFSGKDWDKPMVKYYSETYAGEEVVKNVLSTMTMSVNLLDITLLTQLQKDGHPLRIVNGA